MQPAAGTDPGSAVEVRGCPRFLLVRPPRPRPARAARLPVDRDAVHHLPDRRAVAGAGPDRPVAHLPRRLRRHDFARADDGGGHRGLHGGDLRRSRERRHEHQPGLAVVAGGAGGARHRHGVRRVHRLALGAHRGHLHHHDHARGGVAFYYLACRTTAFSTVSGLPSGAGASVLGSLARPLPFSSWPFLVARRYFREVLVRRSASRCRASATTRGA